MSTPIDKRAYVMSESDGRNRRYRLVIGFESLKDLQDAHEYVVKLPRPTEETSVVPFAESGPEKCRHGKHPHGCTTCNPL